MLETITEQNDKYHQDTIAAIRYTVYEYHFLLGACCTGLCVSAGTSPVQMHHIGYTQG